MYIASENGMTRVQSIHWHGLEMQSPLCSDTDTACSLSILKFTSSRHRSYQPLRDFIIPGNHWLKCDSCLQWKSIENRHILCCQENCYKVNQKRAIAFGGEIEKQRFVKEYDIAKRWNGEGQIINLEIMRTYWKESSRGTILFHFFASCNFSFSGNVLNWLWTLQDLEGEYQTQVQYKRVFIRSPLRGCGAQFSWIDIIKTYIPSFLFTVYCSLTSCRWFKQVILQLCPILNCLHYYLVLSNIAITANNVGSNRK